MSRAFSYDLHVHSCLSPCGDDESTPNSIAGLASLIGLDIVAVTDHNSCGNCAAFFAACERYGVTPVPGMEMTTAEDIHLLCLFGTLDAALAFEKIVSARRPKIRNRPAAFGRQLYVDENDKIVGEEEFLLVNAADIPLEEAAALVRGAGGAAVPAHIDREANGILAVLGALPESPVFPAVEVRYRAELPKLMESVPLAGRRILFSSDAHTLTDLSEAEHFLELDAEKGDDDGVRRALIALLNAGVPA